MADNPNPALNFNPNPPINSGTATAYNGREWTFNRDRNIWQLTNVNVLVFDGGDAINVGPSDTGSVETNFDMMKVSIGPSVTDSEV